MYGSDQEFAIVVGVVFFIIIAMAQVIERILEKR